MSSTLWNDLLEAFGETMLASVAFVTLFSVGVRTLGRNHPSTSPAPGTAGPAAAGGSSPGENVNLSEAGAVLCFVLCFVILVFGIYLAATK